MNEKVNKESRREGKNNSSLAGKTIGFFVHNIHDDYGLPLWLGARDAALEEGVRPLCFCGMDLGGNDQANILFHLAGKENVDGLLFVGGIMCNIVGVDGYAKFIERYRPLPMASIVVQLKGIPSLMGENEQGTREAITHLVKVHNRRRIAFVMGPKNNNEADMRLSYYKKTLAELGLPADDALISEPGSFDDASGRRAVELFLDKRRISFDGLFAANDNMAIAAMESLRRRGIEVPEKVSVIGFDDQTISRYTTPPMSSVRHSFYNESYQAAKMLLALLRGEKTEEKVVVPSALIIRQSCGCIMESVLRAAAGKSGKRVVNLSSALSSQKEKTVAAMSRMIDEGQRATGWGARLFDAFCEEVTGGGGNRRPEHLFIKTMSAVLNSVMENEKQLHSMEDALSEMRRELSPLLRFHRRARTLAEDLWHQARVLVCNAIERFHAGRRINAAGLEARLREINQILITNFNTESLMKVLVEQLPPLGIGSCYISLYEHPSAPLDGLRLVLNLTDGKVIPLPPEGKRLNPGQLVPEEFFRTGKTQSLVLQPLYFREEKIGIAVFEGGHPVGSVYESFRSQLSGSLKGALLLTQIQNHARILAEGIEDLTATLEEMARNIESITENMSRQSAAVMQGASSIEEMVKNIDGTTAMANKVKDFSGHLNQTANEGGVAMKQSIEAILDVQKNSHQIMSILNLIKSIADQTNILALNAAIQAARAGETGRGFSIVASKVRTLADDTNNNIRVIEDAVKAIVSRIRQSTELAEKTGVSLEKITSISRQNTDITDQLNFAMVEQDNGAKEILRATQELVNITEEVRNAMAEQKRATDDFNTSLLKLRDLSRTSE